MTTQSAHVSGLMGLLLMTATTGWTAPASESTASGFSVAVASAAVLDNTALMELSGTVAVMSVELSAGSVIAVLGSTGTAASVSVEFSLASYTLLKDLIGVPLQSVVHASGTALVVGTKVVAFIPNVAGETLLWASGYGK